MNKPTFPNTFNYLFDSTQDYLEKRRKLSALSHSTDSQNGELNESFKRMALINRLENLTCSGSQTSSSPPAHIYIPTPIKQSPVTTSKKQVSPQKFTLQENEQSFINTNQTLKQIMAEQLGIQKYLNLDRDQTISDLLKEPQLMLERIQKQKPSIENQNYHQFNQSAKQPCFYPYGVPANFDFLIKSSQDTLRSQIEEQEKIFKASLEVPLIPPVIQGKLTKEQRAEKVRLYLQKKENRQWGCVKYTARKQLADQRKRVCGKFVKQEKMFSWLQSEIIIKHETSSSISPRLTQSWEGNQEKKMLKDQKKQLENLKKSTQFND